MGVTRTKQPVTNFELVAQWRHLKSGGNSGIFVWAPRKALTDLKPNTLPPGGIEVQVLDHGYAEQYEKRHGKKPDWFTTHGDVFPVGSSKMKPFPPVSPDGSRSFPPSTCPRASASGTTTTSAASTARSASGSTARKSPAEPAASPASGYLCLESEGSPVEFKNLRIRELP